MPKRTSDHVFHPPSGSSLPGSSDPNPYVFYPPDDIRGLIKTEKDEGELAKMKSALKQWERIYVFPGYPYRRAAAELRAIAAKLLRYAEKTPVPRQQTYYNDSQVPEGRGEIMDALEGLYDNQDNIRFDYNRQGERPVIDTEMSKGDFSSPREPPIGDSVKERGSGPDPEGMDAVEPPTGGNIDGFPSNIG